jgi:hypothetical protein
VPLTVHAEPTTLTSEPDGRQAVARCRDDSDAQRVRQGEISGQRGLNRPVETINVGHHELPVRFCRARARWGRTSLDSQADYVTGTSRHGEQALAPMASM